MKRIRLILISTAAVVGIGGAFASKTEQNCTSRPQFYRDGNYFVEAGVYGVDYLCSGSTGICTYYQPNPVSSPNFYLPCRNGFFMPLY